jgi:hypothetical protein
MARGTTSAPSTFLHNTDALSQFHFRQGDEHKYAYDEETLLELTNEFGFTEGRRREFDQSLDLESRRGSLYVVALKPR